eukprot:scaffold1501_cov130-Cylindrotheca_fusiformis.AAC.7
MKGHADGEQPFPDSWIATTAPVALGTMTDVASEIILMRGAEGASDLWPLVGSLIQLWCNGAESWEPCEALVRVACHECKRLSKRVPEKIKELEESDAVVWSNALVSFYQETLCQGINIEQSAKERLVEEKAKAFQENGEHGNGIANQKLDQNAGEAKGMDQDAEEAKGMDQNAEEAKGVDQRVGEANELSSVKSFEVSSYVKLVPSLKVRCVAAHFLQQALESLDESVLVPFLDESVIKSLLDELNRSRDMAEIAAKNEYLALAFQEAILSEWGMDEENREEALMNVAMLSQTQGSAMFFLTQTAGATNVMIQVLSALYENGKAGASQSFAIPYLLKIMEDVFSKFSESESKEGHRMGGGIKVATYCTTFASTIVCLLKAILAFDQEHFEQQKAAFFPMALSEALAILAPTQYGCLRSGLVERALARIPSNPISFRHARSAVRHSRLNEFQTRIV